jgi:hydroxyacylglutathione hydrolase
VAEGRQPDESLPAGQGGIAMSVPDARSFTVGPVQENTYIVRSGSDATRGVIVDPGDEAARLLEAVETLGIQLDAVLVTHCHFDHIGAVAEVARATGAPVYCPEIERGVLADVMSWVPPGFGPFESYEADHTVAGGERLTLAGLDIEVIFTPGHSPGHVTYAIAPSTPGGGTNPVGRALLSGDVLFQGSVGRVDLPGGDWATLERSIGGLLRAFPPETVVYPGHMGVTTLGRERDTNPFLAELRSATRAAVVPDAAPARR